MFHIWPYTAEILVLNLKMLYKIPDPEPAYKNICEEKDFKILSQ